MALTATRLQIHNAIVARLESVFTTRPVFGWIRRPIQSTEGQVINLFNDDQNILNVISVRLLGLRRQTDGVPVVTVSIDYYFEIEVRRVINDTDDSTVASEVLFNADLDSIDAAFTDYDFGLDAGVSSRGIEILRPIERDPQPFYNKGCHVAYVSLMVTSSEC